MLFYFEDLFDSLLVETLQGRGSGLMENYFIDSGAKYLWSIIGAV